jgi:hypothetical protein
MKRYEEITVTNPDTGETSTMYELVAPRGEKSGKEEDYIQCSVCGFWYPKSKLTRVAGRWYCSRYGCINDTRGIRK